MANRFFNDSTDNVVDNEIIIKEEVQEKEDYLLSDIGKSSHSYVDENSSSIKEYVCEKCGASFYSCGEKEDCIFCGCKCNIESNSFDIDGYSYLPFNKTIDDAVLEYKKIIKGKLFINSSFKKKNLTDNIIKIYCPVLLKCCKVDGKVVFYAADNDKTEKKLLKYEVCNTVNVEYTNLVFSLSSKLSQKDIFVMNEYDFNSILSFDNELLTDSNLCFIKSDIDNNESIDADINKNVVSLVREKINHDLRKLKDNNTDIKTTSLIKVFLPAYIMKINNKDKDYLFFMNGQNGNSYLDFEISKVKIIIISIIVFILIFVLVFFVVSII